MTIKCYAGFEVKCILFLTIFVYYLFYILKIKNNLDLDTVLFFFY